MLKNRPLSYVSIFAILGLVWTALALVPLMGQSSKSAALEIRLAEEQPAPGLIEAALSRSGKNVYLFASVVISNEDLADARVIQDSGGTGFSIEILFSAQGSEKMAEATEAHIGKPVAILVNGVVIAAPILRSPIRQSAVVTGDWTKEQADEIASGLKVTRGAIGISYGEPDASLMDEGIPITGVAPGKPAARAGLRPGDIIIEIDGKKTTTGSVLLDIIANEPIGKTVQVKISRDGVAQTIPVIIEDRKSTVRLLKNPPKQMIRW